ncbi:MAG: NAD(P)-binding domain-containing protein [Pseudomonadota bacterium]
MSIPFIGFDEGEALADWRDLAAALRDGHQRPRAEIGDTFLYRDHDTLLSRAAWIDGMGAAVKTATIFPGNAAPLTTINGAVSLFDDDTGTLAAMIDFHLVTKWKTAGDSLLGALHLARDDSRSILILGAGTVAASLIEAFSAGFPGTTFAIWNRSPSRAAALANSVENTVAVTDLPAAVDAADIILGATMTTDPILHGDWLRPGQHVNLIGAYRADMREADDRVLARSNIYVDSISTTLDHIGELKIPLATGAITREDVIADFYNLDRFDRAGADTITVFKNGGGAHLDLMTSRYLLDQWRAAQ